MRGAGARLAGALSVSGGGPALDFFSAWDQGPTGGSDLAVTDNNKGARWGGGSQLSVIDNAGSGLPFPPAIPRLLRVPMGTGDFDWDMWLNKWTAPAVGEFRRFRWYMLNNVSNSVNAGTGYAATHPIELEANAGGIGGNYGAMHVGSRTDGTGEFYIDFGNRQFTPGPGAGANPNTLPKFVAHRMEMGLLRTATTTFSFEDFRIYRVDPSTFVESLIYDRNSMYVWGGGSQTMATNGAGITLDQPLNEWRKGINGGFTAPAGNYLYFAGFATSKTDWPGPYVTA